MGIFGARDPLSFGMQQNTPELYSTSPIGLNQAQVTLPQDPQVARALQPGFFGKGGKGWGILGALGDAFQVAGGGQSTFGPAQQRWQEMEAERQNRLAEMMMKRKQPSPVNLGNGGFGIWSPEGGFQIEREPQQQPGEQERLLARYLDPNTPAPEKEAIAPLLRNYQYTAPVMEAKQQNAVELADHRFGNSMALRSAPTYANLHPSAGGGGRGLTPTARAKYIADAQGAIARGADPAKVRARLQQMGVE